MKKGLKYLTFLVLLAALSSCASYKKNLILKTTSENFPSKNLSTPNLEYKLQNSDIVYVEIDRLYMGDEAYTISDHLSKQIRAQQTNPYLMGIPLDVSGKISIPLIGEVVASGLTIDELDSVIQIKASEVYSTVSVKVFLLTQNVTVIGEVAKSGRYQYYTENLNLFDAIGLAGGFTSFSDLENIKILREIDDSTKVFHVNLSELNSFDPNLFHLRNNDVLIISAQKRKRLVTNNNFGALLSSITVIVTVLSLVISLNSK